MATVELGSELSGPPGSADWPHPGPPPRRCEKNVITKIEHLSLDKKHFFLQLIRIIKNIPENKFSFVRLGQIAYNIGQLSVYIDSDPIYTEGPRDYYYSNKLNQLESYIDTDSCEIDSDKLEELEELEKQIDEKLNELKKLKKGGNLNYYNKYLKYKQKYFKLKHNN